MLWVQGEGKFVATMYAKEVSLSAEARPYLYILSHPALDVQIRKNKLSDKTPSEVHRDQKFRTPHAAKRAPLRTMHWSDHTTQKPA
eukprot:2686845-Prymnesium_polylepis.2